MLGWMAGVNYIDTLTVRDNNTFALGKSFKRLWNNKINTL